MRRISYSLLLLIFLAVPTVSQQAISCENVEVNSTREFQRDFKFLDQVTQIIKTKQPQIEKILEAVDSAEGAKYEIEQALKTIEGVKEYELQYLLGSKKVESIAIYGSTNIPLYTLVLHAFIPSLKGRNIFFRTPAATREVYRQLFELFEASAPPGTFKDINILIENKDVQYDSFRKQYVMGLNKKGKRFVRNPADLVVFTGSPETGRRVVAENQAKMEKLLPDILEHNKTADNPFDKQVFMMFGAGHNPIVVAGGSKGENLKKAVAASTEAIEINCAQDCIAPNFIAVQQSSFGDYVSALKTRVNKMKFGEKNAPNADYNPLTFETNFEALGTYKQKYREFLVTPEAQINPETKRVDPHIFVFPFEMFGKVELVEHYAPFIVVFSYKNSAQLERILTSQSVQQKAMMAAVYGEKGTPEFEATVEALRDSNHITYENKSLFSEENGNLPFGGSGPDASSVAVLSINSNNTVGITSQSRPLLVSQEMIRHFPTKEITSR